MPPIALICIKVSASIFFYFEAKVFDLDKPVIDNFGRWGGDRRCIARTE